MDIDDSSDKVRRNVVVFCSALIAFQFLKIDVQQVTAFGIPIGSAHPLRTWIALIMVMSYLGLRYHFDAQTAIQRTSANEDFNRVLTVLMKRILARSARAYLAHGDITRAPKSLPSFVNHEEVGKIFQHKDRHQLSLTATVSEKTSSGDVRENIFEGIVWLDVTFPHAYHGHEYTIATGFRFRRRYHFLLRIYGFFRLSAWSKSSVDVLIPYFLWVIALALSLYRIYRLLF